MEDTDSSDTPDSLDGDGPEPLNELSGYETVRKIREFMFKCPECGNEISTLVNNECSNCGYEFETPEAHSSTRVVYQTDCKNCGFGISITDDNRTDFDGYQCYNCGNIVAVHFKGTFYQPVDLLETYDEGVTEVDTEHKRVVASMLEFQADVGSDDESDEGTEDFNVLLCRAKNAYCGFLVWEGNVAKRIWVGETFDVPELVADLIEYWCNQIVEDDSIVIESVDDELAEIIEGLEENDEIFGKKVELVS